MIGDKTMKTAPLTEQERQQIVEFLPPARKLVTARKVDDINSVCVVHLPGNTYTPYVRWWFNHQSPGFFWGHYHATLEAAMDDLDETVHGLSR